MKEEKNIYISEEASYPSLDTLNKYANGELPDDEKEQVEETIENDPFMADVLDGLSESTDLVLVKQSINRIKLNSQKRLFAAQPKKRETLSKRQSRIAPNKYTQLIIATAAAIAFLFVTVFIVEKLQFKDGSENLAMNKGSHDQVEMQDPEAQFIPADSSNEERANEASELIASSNSIDDKEENTMRQSLTEEEIAEKPALIASEDLNIEHEISEEGPLASPKPISDNIIESTSEDDFDATTSRNENRDEDIIVAKKQKELEARRAEAAERSKILTEKRDELTAEEIAAIPVQKENTALIPLDERLRKNMNKELAESGNTNGAGYQKPTDAPLMKEDDIKKGEYLKGMAMADLLTEAIRLYDDRSYNASLNNVLEVLQSQPENLVAKYYAGGCYFSIKQYKLAIPYLKSVSKVDNTDFQDDARWLLARSYAARGKKKNAIIELDLLIKEKTKYSSDAVLLMEELKR